MQQYAVWFILLQKHSTCFGCPPHPSSGVLKTVTAASSTGHNIGTATSLQRGQVGTWPRWREVSVPILWPVPETVVTVFTWPRWRKVAIPILQPLPEAVFTVFIWPHWREVKKKKSKAVPLQAWSGPEASRNLRFPDFMTTAQGGGEVVSLTHRPPLPPGNTPGTHFC